MPITSFAPRLAETNAKPVIQAGIERPERKKSVLVFMNRFRAKPMPSTNSMYTSMMSSRPGPDACGTSVALHNYRRSAGMRPKRRNGGLEYSPETQADQAKMARTVGAFAPLVVKVLPILAKRSKIPVGNRGACGGSCT